MVATFQEFLLTQDNQPQVPPTASSLSSRRSPVNPGSLGPRLSSQQDGEHVRLSVSPGYDEIPAPGSGRPVRAVLDRIQRVLCPRIGRRPGQAWRRGFRCPALSGQMRRAAVSERPVIAKAYRTVRGGAAKHIVTALP